MRCSGWSSLAISVCSAIALVAGPAAAHVVATPAFLPSEKPESIAFSAPNEREQPMTAFALTVPDGLVIEHAHRVAGWTRGDRRLGDLDRRVARTRRGGRVRRHARRRRQAPASWRSRPSSATATAAS